MRIAGYLFMVGAEDRTIPIELSLDDTFRILDEGGTLLGVVDPHLVSVDQTSDTTFLLRLADRTFGFTPAEAGPSFLTELAGGREASVESPAWDDGAVESGTGAKADRDTAARSDAVGPVTGSVRPLNLTPIRTSDTVPEVEHQADEQKGLRPFRLEPGLAARLGLPLRPLRKQKAHRHSTIAIGGVNMAYRAEGRGRPVVLIGGGIGSMDIWDSVVPQISSTAQTISIDLIGFGASDRIPGADVSYYDWDTHVAYLDACLDALGLEDDLTLVSHGLNTIVALEWARLHEDRVRAISYADGVVRPMAWAEAQPWLREAVKRARGGDMDDYFLTTDEFVDDALKEFVPGPLSSDLIDAYHRAIGPPGTARLAHMAAIANIPLGGDPPRASHIMHECYDWLKATPIPKLLILGRPGYFLIKRGRKLASRLPHQTVATVDGRHLLPHTAPDAIGRFIQLWLNNV